MELKWVAEFQAFDQALGELLHRYDPDAKLPLTDKVLDTLAVLERLNVRVDRPQEAPLR